MVEVLDGAFCMLADATKFRPTVVTVGLRQQLAAEVAAMTRGVVASALAHTHVVMVTYLHHDDGMRPAVQMVRADTLFACDPLAAEGLAALHQRPADGHAWVVAVLPYHRVVWQEAAGEAMPVNCPGGRA